MQYNAHQKDSASQKRDRQPGEVNAGLLMIVSGVLIGTCLTVVAFLTSTSSIDAALPQAAIVPADAGCSCAGTTAKPSPTQPS